MARPARSRVREPTLSKSAVPRRVAPRRDFKALEERRMRAGAMFERGVSQAEVARELGVSRETASEWSSAFRSGGLEALAGAGRAGRLPKLSDAQLVEVEQALLKGPRSNGFPTELWTLARVATVIEQLTGVAYSTTQTWWILRERLGWSRQRPARKALEGDDEAIVAWARDRWPVVKRTPDAGTRGSSSKTSPVSRSSPR
jgi:transposase